MKDFKDISINEFKNIVAVLAIALGMFIAMGLEQKDLSCVLAGALSGIVTMHSNGNSNGGGRE